MAPLLMHTLALLLIPLTPVPAAPVDAATTSYFVDAAGGDDTASGLDESHAWRSLDRVNATTFQPGDRILLRAGDHWTGQLWPKGSGADGAPITIDSYGSGAKPRLDGAGTVADVVRLFNQEHWAVRNLEVTNTVPPVGTPGANLLDLRGIHISGDNGQTLDGFVVEDVNVHDVSGEVNWIGGSVADNAPGVHFQTGWDGSKKTGGIVLDTTVADITAPGATATVLNDVTVQHSVVANTSFAGIVVKQYTGDGTGATGTGWGSRTGATDPKFTPHTNIVIRDNYITQEATDYGCNGMYITDVRGAVIEHNVVARTGTSGIEMYFADAVTVQFNEVFETAQKAGGADSNGIDPDKGTTGILVQYNFVHGNGDGILICQFAFGNVVIRDNVIASNTRYQIYLHSDRAAVAKVYNNTIYNDKSGYLVYGYGSSLAASYTFTNNVFYSTRAGAALTVSPTISYDNNLYGGAELAVPDSDASPVVADPWFTAAPLGGPSGTPASGPRLDTAYGLRVRSGSATIDTGKPIADNGGRDYAGAPLYNGAADIGAFEYATSADATTEAVTGVVRDPAGAPLSGVVVAVAGASTAATTGADGRFAVTGVPFGTGRALTATRAGYQPLTRSVDVRSGNVTTVQLTLTSTSGVGAVAGRVLDQTARPVSGARITVLDDGQTLGTATSDANGDFRAADLPVGTGYVVRFDADGLVTATRTGIAVTPSATTAVGTVLLVAPVPDYLAVHDFDALPTGTLASGTDGLTVSAAGGRVDVAEQPSATDKSARLTRTTNSGSTSVSQAFTPALAGIVTVEATIMRDDPDAAGNNYFGVPYIRGSTGQNAISLGFTKSTIVAYAGSTLTTIGGYQLGRWYHLSTVLDTVNQSFDLYLDGRLVLAGARFRNPMDGVAQVDFYANSSNYGSVHVDDLRVSHGIGLSTSETGLATLTTDRGTPAATAGGGYLLDVPTDVARVAVTTAATSPFARSVAIAGGPATGPRAGATIVLGGDSTQVPIAVTAEDGTVAVHPLEIRRSALPADGATRSPATAVLATTDGWLTGLHDGSYHVTMNLWWGVNASVYILYENGVEISRQSLTPAGLAAQSAVVAVTSRPNGTYVYTGELRNQAGRTTTSPVTVVVTDADPGKPTLSADNWDGDGAYTVSTDLWWGTNATQYRLYEDGELVDTRQLTAASPNAQHAATTVTGRASGTHRYVAELSNAAGTTRSDPLVVTVTLP